MELEQLRGVGLRRLEALHAAGIDSLRDLLSLLPCRYLDMGAPTPVAQVAAGESALFSVRRIGEPKLAHFAGRNRVTCAFEDESGRLTAVWFNQPWMKQTLMSRDAYLLYGRAEDYRGRLQLICPSVEEAARVAPIYRPIEGVPRKLRESLVVQALAFAEALCPELLPETLRRQYELEAAPWVMAQLHRPTDMDSLRRARRTHAFTQSVLYQAAVWLMRGARSEGVAVESTPVQRATYWRSLPFAPTEAQRRTLEEIADDLSSAEAMARMVQGDVGCGKTAVAFGAMALCAGAGYQAALMAPTEILARQHMESARRTLEPLGIRCGLLLGGMPAAERRTALEAIRSGEWQVVIGTHALIGKAVRYHRLALCVTDEQHRFGVAQRTELLDKAEGGLAPNLLVMSATPIPRSLALVMYGDLSVSVIDQMPPGRRPVETRLVPEAKREAMYGFVREQLAQGRQAYVVCPLVEDGEDGGELRSVESLGKALEEGPLKDDCVGYTYGAQPSLEKQAVLEGFAEGSIQALVATTVIEVGVNVPNASVMVVENADRFGLAQLHQLRGRVGRGGQESWCFLVAKENERLRALLNTNDGFAIAQEDLRLRGPGELLGTRQHGAAGLSDALSALTDLSVLQEAQTCARRMRDEPQYAEAWRRVQRAASGALADSARRVSIS